ncbi:hypothetical protein C2S51_038026 [Perilla frutescens var. frutescens]|nr:hypothetical protein C2S51_038026 [Perilla frutescens var. frutescens]
MYSFKPFEEVQSMENNTESGALFDVIRVVVERVEPRNQRTSNGCDRRLIEIVLEDKEKRKLFCTLWDEYVDVVMSLFKARNQTPNICIVQMCRTSMYKGEIRVCNTFNVTKILLNEDIPEMNEFRLGLVVDSTLSTTVISSISSGIVQSITNELSTGEHALRTIEQMIFDDDFQGMMVGPTFHVKIVPRYWRRYKLRVTLVDDTGSVSFLMWDSECLQLIGKAAGDLDNETMDGDDLVVVPMEILKTMLDQKILLKVNVKADKGGYKKMYTATKVTADPLIVNSYSLNFKDNQESHSISNLKSSNKEEINLTDTTPITT